MITWNYRVFQEPDGDYVIREVFYEDGAIISCTKNPVEPYGRTLDELTQSIEDFRAALNLAVLTLDAIPQQTAARQRRSKATKSSDQVRAALGLLQPELPVPPANLDTSDAN